MIFFILNDYWAETELAPCTQHVFDLLRPCHITEQAGESAARNRPRSADGQRTQDAHGTRRLGRGAR
jgi:hypothetical protein